MMDFGRDVRTHRHHSTEERIDGLRQSMAQARERRLSHNETHGLPSGRLSSEELELQAEMETLQASAARSQNREARRRGGKGDGKHNGRYLKYLEAAMAAEERREFRQRRLGEISDKSYANRQSIFQLQSDIAGKNSRGFTKEQLKYDLKGLRAEEGHLHFEYLNLVSAQLDEIFFDLPKIGNQWL